VATLTSGERATLLVTLQARGEHGSRLRDELQILATMSRADAGCIRYEVLEEADRPNRFVLWEEWVDEASLADHNRQPHVKRFGEVSPPLLLTSMQVRRLRRSG
jgi:quinol monooxygenase YgiN